MNIDEYLKEWRDTTDGWIDKSFYDLLHKGDTSEAARIWSEIADGTASVPDTLMWAKHVATKVVKQVVSADTFANRRAEAALKAIGFSGQIDKFRDAKRCMEVLGAFDIIDDQGNSVPKRWSGRKWVESLRSMGFLNDVPDNTAITRVNEWRKEFGLD